LAILLSVLNKSQPNVKASEKGAGGGRSAMWKLVSRRIALSTLNQIHIRLPQLA
jgi:hypothetical protein